MRPKTERQEAITKITSAMMDRWNADQFTQRLLADPFWRVFLQLRAIYTDLGEPFVIVNPTTQERELNMCLVREPQTKKKQRVQHHSPFLAMDQSALIQGRQRADASTQRIVASWAKAGIPSSDVWEILEKITPF